MGGKRKIPMSMIENDQSRMVSFSKRRKTLFNKAAELSVLTGARTAVLILSNAGRPHSFVSSPSVSVDSFVTQFLSASSSTPHCSESLSLGHGHGHSLSFSVDEFLSESLGDGDSPSISVDDFLLDVQEPAVPGASAITGSSIGDSPSVSVDEFLIAQAAVDDQGTAVPGTSAITYSLTGDFSESVDQLFDGDFSNSFGELLESEFFESLHEVPGV